MEQSAESKLQLWYEVSRVNAAQMKVDGRQWRKKFFLYLSAIGATIAVAGVLAR
jgi:hypothetical protein